MPSPEKIDLPIQSDRETWLVDVAATAPQGVWCYRQDRWKVHLMNRTTQLRHRRHVDLCRTSTMLCLPTA